MTRYKSSVMMLVLTFIGLFVTFVIGAPLADGNPCPPSMEKQGDLCRVIKVTARHPPLCHGLLFDGLQGFRCTHDYLDFSTSTAIFPTDSPTTTDLPLTKTQSHRFHPTFPVVQRSLTAVPPSDPVAASIQAWISNNGFSAQSTPTLLTSLSPAELSSISEFATTFRFLSAPPPWSPPTGTQSPIPEHTLTGIPTHSSEHSTTSAGSYTFKTTPSSTATVTQPGGPMISASSPVSSTCTEEETGRPKRFTTTYKPDASALLHHSHHPISFTRLPPPKRAEAFGTAVFHPKRDDAFPTARPLTPITTHVSLVHPATCTTTYFTNIPLLHGPTSTVYAQTTTETDGVSCRGCALRVVNQGGIGPVVHYTTTITLQETKTLVVLKCEPTK